MGSEMCIRDRIVSVPGCPPQIVHADASWTPRPLLLTSFVACQPVTREMGPTRFLPRTHYDSQPSEVVAESDATHLGTKKAPPSWVGLLNKGDCTLYDGRLLHCGGANRSDKARVLFYVTFRAGGGDGRKLSEFLGKVKKKQKKKRPSAAYPGKGAAMKTSRRGGRPRARKAVAD